MKKKNIFIVCIIIIYIVIISATMLYAYNLYTRYTYLNKAYKENIDEDESDVSDNTKFNYTAMYKIDNKEIEENDLLSLYDYLTESMNTHFAQYNYCAEERLLALYKYCEENDLDIRTAENINPYALSGNDNYIRLDVKCNKNNMDEELLFTIYYNMDNNTAYYGEIPEYGIDY